MNTNRLFCTTRCLLSILSLALATATEACVASTGSESDVEQGQSVADDPAAGNDGGAPSSPTTGVLPDPSNEDTAAAPRQAHLPDLQK
jgi:hypothetical protein